MHFSTQYALLFIAAGFASAAYLLRTGQSARKVPIIALAVCALYTLANHGFPYTLLTIIEFGIGFGLAHAVVKTSSSQREHDNQDG
jgi:hypothetical protein